MNRINYLTGWSERATGVALPSSISPALRAPLVALAAALALVALLWTVQHARLLAAVRQGTAYEQRLAELERGAARVRAVERDVVRLRTLSERVDQVRRSGDLRAGEIAALGNRLPDGVWLTSLRAERGLLALEGRSALLDSVGATMDALGRLPAYAGARLVAVHGEPARTGVTYAVELEPRR